ncbi:hypothetical protein D3C76_1731030 [compost metagenome]
MRLSRVTPRWVSRLRTLAVTVALAMSSDSAARLKLAHSTTRVNTCMAQSLSIRLFIFF